MRPRVIPVLLAALFVPVVLCGATVKEFHKIVALAPQGELSVDSHNGSVTVKAWNRPEVSIDARIEPADHGEPSDVQKTNIDVSASSGRVRVSSDYSAVPSHPFLMFGSIRALPPVHYTIQLPATATVRVEVHNAYVKVDGLSGKVDLRTHNGAVSATNLGGPAEVETHNGHIQLTFARFTAASRVETHNGAVSVAVPKDARMTVRASAHSRSPIDSNLPLVVRSTGSEFDAALNGGGPALRFISHNGTMELSGR